LRSITNIHPNGERRTNALTEVYLIPFINAVQSSLRLEVFSDSHSLAFPTCCTH
jgi:hypothetical protein